MTTIPDPDSPDTGDSAVPPYDGRKESADMGGPEDMHKDGAAVGGASNPIESDHMKATPKEDTPRGAEASPADEQPASGMPETDMDPDMVDTPAHTPGTGRGEDKSEDSR
ncbi:MAG: hypothetical protein M3492_12615 [Actinomycetota bacterium]|nr:hypothetical protein [Actinomycetota bacterium]